MKKFTLFLNDLAMLYGALALTILLRYTFNFESIFRLHFLPFTIIFCIWLIVFFILNLYEIANFKNNAHFYSDFFKSVAIAFLISVVFFYTMPLYGITPKTNLVIFALLFTILGFLSRFLLNNIFQKSFKRDLVIVGLNKQSLELARFIKENPQNGYRLTHVVDLNALTENIESSFEEFGLVKGIDGLENLIKQEKVNTIIISPEVYKQAIIINLLYKSLDKQVNFLSLSAFYEKITGMVPLESIDQFWFLENLSEGSKRAYDLGKRIFDILLGLIIGAGFLVTSPLIYLAVKIDSKGPFFYRQKRVGQYGGDYEMLKLRTMTINAEANGAVWAQEDDPRVTRVGKFLRKTRIDELPQVWNILRGEMSFVGPRAERPEFHDKLKNEIPFYEERYLIKPGLTGWAQINYHYGASIDDSAQKLKYDLYYIKNRSIPLDLGIVLKTIRIALQQAGR